MRHVLVDRGRSINGVVGRSEKCAMCENFKLSKDEKSMYNVR